MVPAKTHPTWGALIEGRLECKFSNAAASMLLFRVQNDVRRDASAATRGRAIDELHAFFMKHERTMETELKTIFD